MSSTGPKSLAGLTRARHRGNVAPSNSRKITRKASSGPALYPPKIPTEKVRHANFAQPVDGTVSHSIRINLRVGNDSLTTKLRGE